ncbi:uncharacterized protein Z520_05447 [Fonsecaea multimorphosa CBS 102226]|uniref:L-tryptophan decarboxylase PsiD-like domain-containing protein n=1 Tax=Fonsecaea multimorphosa CBS 102226 TaxID=1442371 RepID=A0A0D2IPX8_9EURO|nr:uncharacterized protein Z520_05447 [Fonsecaea multimorphosa CBS 102226]KIX98986.1 hypothetical protein Z520_05447 [Fonsecaea multimorphosa CBS 102226]OAL25256.1 hypothetical protein AYO22_05133 [Fonsecaea multimorphosa]
MSLDLTPPFPFPVSGPLDPYVNYLKGYLTKLGRYDQGDQSLAKAIQEGLDEGVVELKFWNITSADNFMYYANYLLTSWIPSETHNSRFIYQVLTVFYYIFDRPALCDLQTQISPDSIEGDMPKMTPLSDWVVGYAKRMGSWLSTSASITKDSYQTFLTAKEYRMSDPGDYKIPDPHSDTGGFQSFNQFFCRFLKEPHSSVRPIDEDINTVVFPADSTFDNAWPIDNDLYVDIQDPDAPASSLDHDNVVEVKLVKWPLSALLAGSAFTETFKGGTWAHVFLNTFDYHRQHAPVSGTVREAFLVEGCAYLQVEAQVGDDGKKRLQPRRGYTSAVKAGDAVAAQPSAPDGAGYQFIQQRGCIVIDTAGFANIGMVAVLPMGMAQVSSVNLSEGSKVGNIVRKGDEISWFEFGGSDLVLVFEAQAQVGDFPPTNTKEHPSPHHLMGEKLCTVKAKAT